MVARGVPNILLQWTKNFLTNRQQRVKINGIVSEWLSANGGVPQGTLAGPLHYQLMSNDFSTILDMIKYVDDSSIYEITTNQEHSQMQTAADNATNWADENKITINTSKTKELYISFGKEQHRPSAVNINGQEIEQVTTAKLLGITLANDLTWEAHTQNIHSRASSRLYFLRQLKRSGAPIEDLIMIYVSSIRSIMEYACQTWATCLNKHQSDVLEGIQRRAMKIVFPHLPYESALSKAKLPTIKERHTQLCKGMFEAMKKEGHKIHHLLPPKKNANYNLRNKRDFSPPKCRTMRYSNSFVPFCLAKLQ